jgi:predicted permease
MPEARRQFRILYRDFLTRLVDLEILSTGGDVQKLLVQFAAMLAAASFTYAVASVPRYIQSSLPHRELLVAAWSEQEFLIASSMAIAGLFSVLAWNTVLPDRRDCLILGLLPVRVRTIFLAKVAAIATALGISVVAINVFTGFSFPFLWGGFRTLGAYWLTQLLAGLFVACTLLALQAVAAQVLTYRLFLRASSFLQLASFFTILGIWFLKPPFSALAAHPRLSWMPSFWFFALFQQLNGTGSPAFGPLAARAVYSLPMVFTIAAAAFGLAYRRNLRRIVEQPDIVPADRSRPATRIGSWLAARVLPAPIERAILLFTARSIARSRQHRLILAAYAGIALAIGLAYTRDLIYGPSSFEAMQVAAAWNQPNGSFLAATMIALFFAVVGARAVFAMPIALPANWIFRLTAVRSPAAYFHAVRKSLYTVAAIPVWIAAAAALFTIWPAWAAAEHVALLVILGTLLVELSLHRFRKIPFACSYLPGKANLNVRLGTWGIGFLFVAAQGVHLEFWAMQSGLRYAVLFAVLLAAAVWARRRTNEFAASPANQLLFEELPTVDIHALDLRRETVYAPEDQYVDRRGTPQPASWPERRPLSILAPAYIPPPSEPFHLRTALEQLLGDLRYGARILTKSPAFSAAAIALIAVGIGGNTAVYSLVHSILSKPAPGVTASGLVSIAPAFQHHPLDPGENSYPNYLDYAAGARTMDALLAFRGERFTASLSGGTYELRGMLVTPNYFRTLGARLVRGREFSIEEARGAAPLAAIIAYHVWQNQFHGAEDVIGQPMTLNGHTATVVGVGPPQFAGTSFAPQLEVCVPLEGYARIARMEPEFTNRGASRLFLMGRLAPGSSVAEARAEFAAISARLAEEYPDSNKDRTLLLEPYSATRFGPVSGPQNRLFMAILMGVALLTLLIVCANVANLMLSRAVARQREMAVRQSIGASRQRIVRILLAEGLVLSLAAAGAALVFAAWACSAIGKFAPPLESGGRFVPDFAPDWRVALYAIALAIASTLVFTLAPALRAWGQDLLPWLRGGEHSIARGRSLTANLLVVAQLALCVLLLTSGSLAWRSTKLMESADLGFTRDHILLAGVDTKTAASSRAQNLALLERMRERLLAVPGVAAASWAVAAPPHSHSWMDVPIESVPSDGTFAGPDYLHTLRVPILAGRDFSAADLGSRGAVAIVNRRLAHALWPDQPAVGRTITVATSQVPVQVIGVVPDAAFNAVGRNGEFSGLAPEERRNYVFLSEALHGDPGTYTFHVRYTGAIPAVRPALGEVDRRVPVFSVRTLQTEFEDFTLPVHTFANFVGISALGALLLASLGLYAIMAFYTARRRRELGIRVALGASPRQVLGTVLREGLLLTFAGLAIGLAFSAAAAKAFGSLLFGISPNDPATYAAVAVTLAVVALLACYVPARKASRVDPMVSLRQE